MQKVSRNKEQIAGLYQPNAESYQQLPSSSNINTMNSNRLGSQSSFRIKRNSSLTKMRENMNENLKHDQMNTSGNESDTTNVSRFATSSLNNLMQMNKSNAMRPQDSIQVSKAQLPPIVNKQARDTNLPPRQKRVIDSGVSTTQTKSSFTLNTTTSLARLPSITSPSNSSLNRQTSQSKLQEAMKKSITMNPNKSFNLQANQQNGTPTNSNNNIAIMVSEKYRQHIQNKGYSPQQIANMKLPMQV